MSARVVVTTNDLHMGLGVSRSTFMRWVTHGVDREGIDRERRGTRLVPVVQLPPSRMKRFDLAEVNRWWHAVGGEGELIRMTEKGRCEVRRLRKTHAFYKGRVFVGGLAAGNPEWVDTEGRVAHVELNPNRSYVATIWVEVDFEAMEEGP